MQRAGVRHLLIPSGNVLRLKPGLVYLQARLGYSVVNLRLDRRAATAAHRGLRTADHGLETRLRLQKASSAYSL
jgi:hypothetical protein